MKRFVCKPLLPILAILCGLSLGTTSGCRHNVNTKNPAVVAVSALADASNTCKTLEDSLAAANTALERIEAQEPDYYAHVKPLLQKVSTANVTAAEKIQQAKNDGVTNWKTAYLAIAQSITPADLTSVGVKNQNSKIIIGASIAGVAALIEAIGGAQ